MSFYPRLVAQVFQVGNEIIKILHDSAPSVCWCVGIGCRLARTGP
jgi:hypothetical protein